jgi:HK97 family phage major capsid protein
MNKLKKLQEDRGAVAKEIRTYLDSTDRAAVADKNNDPKLKDLEARHDNIVAELDAEVRQAARDSQRPVILSQSEERDIAKFDFRKLLTHMHQSTRGASVRPLDGIEAELLQEGENEARDSGIRPHGIMLPRLLVRRENRDMTASGTTSVTGDQGGMTIATQKAALLDDFFNASVMRQAGATVLEGLQGNIDIPRLIAGTAGAKKAETANADEVNPTTLMLSLSPKRLPAYIDLSERLLVQSSANIEAVLRNHITRQMNAVQEVAFFHGDGTNEATGIIATANIGDVPGGAAGAAPTWNHIVKLEEAVDTNNALIGNLHYISNGQIRRKLKETVRVSSTDSMFLLDERAGGTLNGYTPLWTNAISRTLVKGGSGSVCSAIFFGNFADYTIAYWGGIALELVRDKANAIAGLYTLVASAYYDGGVVRPKSFAAMKDALGA